MTKKNINAEIIQISYMDQTKFEYENRTTPYDAEAIVAFDDKLYIFTKNWANYTTALYKVPKIPGNYALRKIDELKLSGMVTSATVIPATKSNNIDIPILLITKDLSKVL